MLRLLRLRNVARVAALALTLGSSLCAQAQVTPSSVQNQINAVPWTNGLGRVPGATFNSILTNLTVVLGQVYSATITAPGASIFATGQVQTTSLLGTLQSAQAPVLTGDVLTSLGSFATVISPGAVTSSKMASGAAAGNLGPASVTASMLASGAAAGNLGHASVTASMLASGAAAGNLGPASVTASMLASGAAAGNLGPASVTASMLGLAYPPPGLGSYVFTGSSIGGAANAITVGATVPTGFTNTYGTSIVFTPATLNTGPTTIAVGAASIENLYRQTPAGVAPMAGGELVPGQIAAATFDGVEFVLTSTGPTAPPGEVAMFNLATCPNGWAAANGASGIADARGRVLRGIDSGAGRDPTGTVLAGGESSAVGPVTLGITGSYSFVATAGSGGGASLGLTGTSYQQQPTSAVGVACSNCTTETRAASVVLLACQKL